MNRPFGSAVVIKALEGVTGQGQPAPVIAAAFAPEMNITRGGAIADAGTDAQGDQPEDVEVTLTYVITNAGSIALTLSLPVVIANEVNCAAAVDTAPAASIASGATSQLIIDYTPTSVGAFSFTVSIANNDANENPYNWTVSGTAI